MMTTGAARCVYFGPYVATACALVDGAAGSILGYEMGSIAATQLLRTMTQSHTNSQPPALIENLTGVGIALKYAESIAHNTALHRPRTFIQTPDFNNFLTQSARHPMKRQPSQLSQAPASSSMSSKAMLLSAFATCNFIHRAP